MTNREPRIEADRLVFLEWMAGLKKYIMIIRDMSFRGMGTYLISKTPPESFSTIKLNNTKYQMKWIKKMSSGEVYQVGFVRI